MSELPISASSRLAAALDELWQASRAADAAQRLRLLEMAPPVKAGGFVRGILVAVSRHLCACALADLEDIVMARQAAEAALAGWERLADAIAEVEPQLVARGHAFHAGLASRHRATYRDLARKHLLDLAGCGGMKSRSIRATVLAMAGDRQAAAEDLDAAARSWRATLPIRMPGLREIELAAAGWYEQVGQGGPAHALRARAASLSGVLSPYPEDGPEVWRCRPTQEALLRFACAAARLPDAIQRPEPICDGDDQS